MMKTIAKQARNEKRTISNTIGISPTTARKLARLEQMTDIDRTELIDLALSLCMHQVTLAKSA